MDPLLVSKPTIGRVGAASAPAAAAASSKSAASSAAAVTLEEFNFVSALYRHTSLDLSLSLNFAHFPVRFNLLLVVGRASDT